MRCPKCGIEMDEVRKLDVVIDSCRSCGGIWLDEGELDKLRAHAASSRQESVRSDDHEKSYRDSDYRESSSHDSNGAKKKKSSVFDLLDMFGGE